MKKREILIPVLMTGILSSIIYLYFGLFPYGELTLAWCDARQQVVPLLMDLKDMISGEQSIFLNLQNAGGMDLWGVLFFFVASPLHLLVALVSKENMFDLFNILVMLKMMLAAGTAFLYFRRRFLRLGTGMTSVLASMYAFSGFCLMFYQNVILVGHGVFVSLAPVRPGSSVSGAETRALYRGIVLQTFLSIIIYVTWW